MIFHILKINKMMPLCNLLMYRTTLVGKCVCVLTVDSCSPVQPCVSVGRWQPGQVQGTQSTLHSYGVWLDKV